MLGIKIPIGTDNSGLDAGVAHAQKKLNSFKGNALRTFAAIGAVSGVVGVMRGIGDHLDRIDKLSKGGLDTEFLQKLGLASDLAGTNLESATKAARMFVKEIRSADGPTAKVVSILNALGLNLADLKKLGADELFLKIANAIGSLDNETDQLAVTTGLLGSRYGDLLPLIQELSMNGLPDVTTATKGQIAAFVELNDGITKTKHMLMTGLVTPFVVVIKSIVTLIRYIAIAGEQLTLFFIDGYHGARRLMGVLEGVFTLNPAKIRDGLSGARKELDYFIQDFQRAYKEGMSDIDVLWNPSEPKALTGDKEYNAPSDGFDVTDEARAAVAALNKRNAERRKERAARQLKRSEELDAAARAPLMKEGADIVSDWEKRKAKFQDPASITVSSMRSIGGGGAAVVPDERAVLAVNRKQLSRLDEINQGIKTLNQRVDRGRNTFN